MTWHTLRDLLVARYDDFRMRLTRQLGSEELARESLQETWLRLHRSDVIGAVQSPAGYVMRVALNIAADRRRSDKRIAQSRNDDLAMDAVPDSAPGPDRTVELRSEFYQLRRAIAALPPRTREILIAARLDGMPQNDIAARFGISSRMVRIELRRALDHCEAYLERRDLGLTDAQHENELDSAPDHGDMPAKPTKR